MRFAPKVSIIIPVYNGADYMRYAIDSALVQTYDNIEVLVVNDGSTDNGETDRIAKSYGDRIRYFIKENGGVATALNLGIQKMEGEYFSWLSHDDMYMPNKIESQVSLLNSLHDKEIVVYSGYNLMDETGEVYSKIDFADRYNQRKLDTPLFNVLKGIANGCTMLIPKSCFEKYGNFDPALPTTQDYEMWFKMFRHVPVKYSSDINVNMRQHANQGSKIIETHYEECNELWISFLKRLTIEEMCRIDETPELFLERTKAFLSTTPYKRAYEYCCQYASDGVEYDNDFVKLLCQNYNQLYKNEMQDSQENYDKKEEDNSVVNRLVFSILNDGVSSTVRKIKRKIFNGEL